METKNNSFWNWSMKTLYLLFITMVRITIFILASMIVYVLYLLANINTIDFYYVENNTDNSHFLAINLTQFFQSKSVGMFIIQDIMPFLIIAALLTIIFFKSLNIVWKIFNTEFEKLQKEINEKKKIYLESTFRFQDLNDEQKEMLNLRYLAYDWIPMMQLLLIVIFAFWIVSFLAFISYEFNLCYILTFISALLTGFYFYIIKHPKNFIKTEIKRDSRKLEEQQKREEREKQKAEEAALNA